MTELQTPPAATTQTATHSTGALIGGLCIALIVGAVANIIAGVMAMAVHVGALGFLIGGVPGAIFIIWGSLLGINRSSFGKGLLIGGCIIGLIGGACGAAMVGTTFR